ncbi:MAG: hypothetical protein HY401_05260 [Elusimicrobia bacterium]|nr:hypothetical protein [Elusimicrobiota bacterium]
MRIFALAAATAFLAFGHLSTPSIAADPHQSVSPPYSNLPLPEKPPSTLYHWVSLRRLQYWAKETRKIGDFTVRTIYPGTCCPTLSSFDSTPPMRCLISASSALVANSFF